MPDNPVVASRKYEEPAPVRNKQEQEKKEKDDDESNVRKEFLCATKRCSHHVEEGSFYCGLKRIALGGKGQCLSMNIPKGEEEDEEAD